MRRLEIMDSIKKNLGTIISIGMLLVTIGILLVTFLGVFLQQFDNLRSDLTAQIIRSEERLSERIGNIETRLDHVEIRLDNVESQLYGIGERARTALSDGEVSTEELAEILDINRVGDGEG